MSKGKKSRIEEAASKIDIRLGDIMGHLGEALDEVVSRLENVQDGDSEIRRERNFDSGNGPVRASAGIRISTLGGTRAQSSAPDFAKPVNTPAPKAQDAQPSGAQRPHEPPQPKVKNVEATIFKDVGHWSLVADMPGITQDDVSWHQDGKTLRIEGRSTARHFRVETDWPDGVTYDALTCQAANGIVELFAKAGGR